MGESFNIDDDDDCKIETHCKFRYQIKEPLSQPNYESKIISKFWADSSEFWFRSECLDSCRMTKPVQRMLLSNYYYRLSNNKWKIFEILVKQIYFSYHWMSVYKSSLGFLTCDKRDNMIWWNEKKNKNWTKLFHSHNKYITNRISCRQSFLKYISSVLFFFCLSALWSCLRRFCKHVYGCECYR